MENRVSQWNAHPDAQWSGKEAWLRWVLVVDKELFSDWIAS